jgi:hypothetical protein
MSCLIHVFLLSIGRCLCLIPCSPVYPCFLSLSMFLSTSMSPVYIPVSCLHSWPLFIDNLYLSIFMASYILSRSLSLVHIPVFCLYPCRLQPISMRSVYLDLCLLSTFIHVSYLYPRIIFTINPWLLNSPRPVSDLLFPLHSIEQPKNKTDILFTVRRADLISWEICISGPRGSIGREGRGGVGGSDRSSSGGGGVLGLYITSEW